MWDKAKDFVVRAFTIIFLATIVIWVLQSFDSRLNMVTTSEASMLAQLGRAIAPIFAPLGFGSWEASTALVTGLTAKEAVVSTLAILMGAPDTGSLVPLLGELFTPLTAGAFLCFTLLYMPCVAAMAAIKRELGSIWKALGVMVVQTTTAWVITFLVYTVGKLLVG